MFTVGSVPYVNAIPLVEWFEEQGDDSPVRVVYDVPSKLPALLEAGSAEAIMVSSVDALRNPGRRMAAGVCIGSDGPVKSVRMFSRVPFSQVQTLALDASSMTSNRLAQIVLAETHGVTPDLRTMPPELGSMLEMCDACVLIGDIGMAADGTDLHVADLGEEWQILTGLPFVWAAWIGDEALTPELTGLLQRAATSSGCGKDASMPSRTSVLERRERIVRHAIESAGFDRETIEDYYFEVMVYRMDDRALAGLREFGRRLVVHGFADAIHFPLVVEAPALV